MWVGFVAQVAILASLTSVVLSLVVGIALASVGRIPIWLGAFGSILFPILGACVLAIVATVRAASGTASNLAKRKAALAAEDVDYAFAREELERRVSSVVTPIGRGRNAPIYRKMRLFSTSGVLVISILILLAFAATSTLILRWFVVDVVVLPKIPLTPWGGGLDLSIKASLGVLLVALVFASFKPSRFAAVLVALVGSSWTLLGGAGLLVVAPLQTTLATAESTISAAFGWIEPFSSSIAASAGGDLAALPLILEGELPSIGLGPAPIVMCAVGVVCMSWAMAEVFAAHRQAGADAKADSYDLKHR